ncbi:hypothetical protein SteCoe_30620 [Stentor coeruleus]|uniref:mitogen-activated protein kinase kinase n=1 Tax=Stentor coeruleus TaxID=5963 RepID=A0A1R2B360_9CILI|nr:hypothetical protein SteCoe_30620 [Stentor coeruleus]
MKEEDTKAIPPSGKPIISSRLPKAFTQPKNFNVKKNQDFKDPSRANEYKKVTELLSPLKERSPGASALRKVIQKLECFPQINEKNGSSINIELFIQSSIKLEEMITLSILKSSCNTGTVRKSLHAPSFKLFATKEIPVNTLANRKRLLDTLKSWQKYQSSKRFMVEVNTSFWNSPEGCVTIVSDYMGGDSLAKLCDSIGSLPERILRSIARRVLIALGHYHKKVGIHGSVTMNRILFDKEGTAKLAINLSTKNNYKDDDLSQPPDLYNDIYNLGTVLLGASLGSMEWLSDIPLFHITIGSLMSTPPSMLAHCCLFHAALSSEGIPYLKRLSLPLQDFLCKITNFSKKTTANELLLHNWMTAEETAGVDLKLKELICMSVVGSKELTINVEKQLSMLMESLQVVLTGRDDVKPPSISTIKELAADIGVKTELLQNRLGGFIIKS